MPQSKRRNKMEKKKDTLTTNKTEKHNVRNYRTDAPGATSGINTPGIELPAFNPPVPNRAWTAMRQGLDIEELTEEEKRDMYYGRDTLL
jgi:hypothetical protein